jgi:glycosyltransferase involved in cell wall biosynthesis
MRLAYFSPLPPAHSGIADYSAALLPHLAQEAAVTHFSKNPDQVTLELNTPFDIRPLQAYPADRWDFDLALYQMGNSSHHDAIYEMALRYPGLVVLHDHGLHHFITDRTVGQKDFLSYIREMGYELGLKGVSLAWDILERRAEHPLFDVPLNSRLVDHSLGLIVHSQTVAAMLAAKTERPIQVIPALMEKRNGRPHRDQLNLSPDALIFASLGFVTAEKRLDLALEAFKHIHQEMPNSHFLIVGDIHPQVDLDALIGRLNLKDAVTCLGFIEALPTFVDWIATADIIVNLRHPTVGETSATALRAMAAGKPVIVFDLGWYGELPDSAVIKVPPLDNEQLLRAMRQLARQPDLRRQLGQAAAAYIQQHHDPAQIVRQYTTFARHLLAGINEKYGAARA